MRALANGEPLLRYKINAQPLVKQMLSYYFRFWRSLKNCVGYKFCIRHFCQETRIPHHFPPPPLHLPSPPPPPSPPSLPSPPDAPFHVHPARHIYLLLSVRHPQPLLSFLIGQYPFASLIASPLRAHFLYQCPSCI